MSNVVARAIEVQAPPQASSASDPRSTLLVATLNSLARAKNLGEVTAVVRTAARRLLDADGVTFVLNEDGFCHYVDEDAIGPLWKGQRFPLRTCMTGWVMLNRTPAIVEDITVDERIPQEAYARTFVKSMAAVPIRSSDPLGAIAAYWATRHRATPGEVQLLQSLAEAASVAMENVRLLARLEQAKETAEKKAVENQILFERAAHELLERERAENDRRLGQEDLSMVLAAGEMGAWEWDVSRKSFKGSPGMSRLTGVATEVEGFSPLSLLVRVNPEDSDTIRMVVNAARACGDPFECEFRYDHPALGQRWFRASGRVFLDDRGAAVRMYGVLQDITQRRHIEQAFRDSERKLRSIFEHVPVGIILVAPDGSLIDANPAAHQMMARSATDLAAIVHAQGQQAGSSSSPPEAWPPSEHPADLRDGKRGWCRVRASMVGDPSPHPRAVLGMLEDITDQKRLAAELVQAQKMESIGRLAGGVAHDFNNALTVLHGWLGLIQPHASSNPQVREGLEAITQVADHAAALTRQLLAFARRQMLEPRVVEMGALVSRVRRLLEKLVGDDVVVTIKPPAIPLRAAVDPGQIEQILLNLAANSRDAMPAGGSITIQTEPCEVPPARGDVPPGSYVLITFKDTGNGIPESVLPFIFEPFFTTKEPGKGTGLGLSMVHGIVKQHGGHLQVETAPSQGTTFRIYLPAADTQVPTPAPAQAPVPAKAAGETILLVEDEPLVRAVAAMTLRVVGYNVLEVETPSAAIALVSSHEGPIHLLLSDVVMPEMNGVALAEKLSTLRPTLRVLLSSGYSEDAVCGSVASRHIAFLPKPYTPELLKNRVREVLDAPSADPHLPSKAPAP